MLGEVLEKDPKSFLKALATNQVIKYSFPENAKHTSLYDWGKNQFYIKNINLGLNL